MAISAWTPPPRPDPDEMRNPTPFAPFRIQPLRTGKVKPAFNPGMETGMFKKPHATAVTFTKAGLQGDEHAYEPHRDPDKAVHQYSSSHYAEWASEIPSSAHLFQPGAFGENLFSDQVDERSLCIGDKIALGDEVVLELTEPRSPCYKLNHRFQVKNMAVRVQTLLRCGWLYRVLTPGVVQPGATFRLLERPHPEWTVARVMYYLFLDRSNVAAMRQIVRLPALGHEIRDKFQARLDKGENEDEAGRQFGGDGDRMDKWNEYRVVAKRRETSSVMAITFEAVDQDARPEHATTRPVDPGSHVRVQLGGHLVRAYSVVSGTSARFTLGVALDAHSRGGSRFLHSDACKVGDVLNMSRITSTFPLAAPPTAVDKHVLIAGGIGITAFLASIAHLEATGQPYELHFSVADEIPFRAAIEALGPKASVYRKARGQRLDLSALLSPSSTSRNTHFYACGPPRLMDAVHTLSRTHSIPAERIHFETFVAETGGDPFEVQLRQSEGKVVRVEAEESLLNALRRVGLDVASSCEVGNCGTCRVEVCKGRVVHRGTGLEEGDKEEGGMLSCVSRGVGRIVVDL